MLRGVALLSHEGHEPHAEHVERGHEGGDDTEDPEDGEPDGSVVSCLHGDLQDQVLGPESAEERESGDGQGSEEHRDGCDLHVLVKASHLPHVLCADCVDD